MASVSNTISKSIPISNDEFSDDTPSVTQKFLYEIKDTTVTLQRVVKHRMNANVNNLSSPAHQEVHNIFKDEIAPIVNQVDARVLEYENERLLRTVVSQDIMSIMKNPMVVDTSDLQIELDRTKEKLET
ncbi:hypothetical protein Tco_0295403 [Tanacetum coccineum]